MQYPGMKCVRCQGAAQYRFPSHNARFCGGCLRLFVERQVQRAIKKFDMLRAGQRVLVAISGGKDSLALWQLLHDLGYQSEAVHLSLEFEEFSDGSEAACQEMARRLERPLHLKSFRDLAGFSMAQVVKANRRQFCSICGIMKRHFLNRLCRDLGIDTLATGHHLDDECGRLLGNLIHNRSQYLDRQWPVLPALGGLARKIKPLVRLDGSELAAFSHSRGLPVYQEKCPHSKGATLPYFQEAMVYLDQKMPGTRRSFYFSFLERQKSQPAIIQPVKVCPRCRLPTQADICNACRLLERTRQWTQQAA